MGLPITFYKSLSSSEMLFSYNNNIVEFEYINSFGIKSVKCEIIIENDTYEVYPNPNNIFRFNFKEAFQKIINQNDFADDIILNVDVNTSSVIIEGNENAHKKLDVTYKIYLDNSTINEESKPLRFIKGVENIKNIADRKILVGSGINQYLFYLLSPFKKTTDRILNLTYWEGYPFDVGYYSFTNQTIDVNINLNIQAFDFIEGTGRFTISDGLESIDQFLPLNDGINVSVFDSDNLTLNLKKVSGGCGKYVKWINKYGHWNYWLFNNRDESQLTTRDGKALFNDFDGLSDNVSPYLEPGKQSKETITLNSSNITADEMYYLKYLFESPKVYLFVGEPNEKMSNDSFIEVKLKGQKTIIDNYKGSTFNIKAQIELPQRNTMTL